MEFHKTLQSLRKARGLTQDELAKALFVSRTAISKWESGRGFPSIESLKTIAAYFQVTLDELMSGEEILTAAKEDQQKRTSSIRDLVFGLLDCSTALLLFLPFFRQATDSAVQSVSLLSLVTIQPFIKFAYLALVIATSVYGILGLALQTCENPFWMRTKRTLSLLLSLGGMCLFILSQQPYAAITVLVFLIIKVCMLLKHA